MAYNSASALDEATLNEKRNMAIQCLAHLAELSTPTNLFVEQMSLVGDEGQPAESGPGISRLLVKYSMNYKKSGLLKRLMFYQNGEWSDYPQHVVELVKKDFETKKATAEVELDGENLVMYFFHMCNMNLKTGLRQPIAWIDEAGSFFFPELFASVDEESNNIGEQEVVESHGMKESQEHSGKSNALAMDVDADGRDTANKMENENIGESPNQDREIDLNAYTEPGYGELDVDYVRNLFLTGMTTFGVNDDDIVDIYCNSSISMQARLELFQKQADITKGIHGDANVRYGWLACSKEELSTIMQNGLDHNALSSSKCIYGFGIHLAAITHPYACVPYCDADENGVKHLILCRVIMGNMELLRRGNNKIRSSGCEYDNGVDDIEHPKYYVVWSNNMNTHIYQEFVVSFKASLDAEGNERSNEIMNVVSGNNSSISDTLSM
ncbi:probable inactive poly [ADP-ribose] polymerase SRO1 [Vicia villosa]|uniref:probable inactive poly [ADP-ribose] polymerase SRO1 n=1 Tax=Vicia villosa TaxID=3911 RepID=UPI00273B0117|nr:probable inactive poly [ADP-ribose] polymerase SRO1 [Vicia villosa]